MTVETLRTGEVARAIRAHRLIVVLRRIEPRERLLGLVTELADAGARIFEITFDATDAAGDIAALREVLAGREDGPSFVGAGTILTAAQLEGALGAGADFGVAPLLDPVLVEAAVRAGLPFVPGAMTPTEVAAGWAAGAAFVKIFPASAVGPAFIRELGGPMGAIPLIPTGGIDATNAEAFLAAGAAAVGIGSAIARAEPGERRALVARLARPDGR